MDNYSVNSFTMTAYDVMEKYKYLQVTVFLLLYLIILCLNTQLIVVICRKKDLHQPMNLFTCNLSVNEMYGSSALFPVTLSLLVSETHDFSLTKCLTQIYFLHTYAAIEFSILALMAYDRYVSICFPLHYYNIMNNRKLGILIVLSWVYPSVFFLILFCLTLQLKFCEKHLHKLYCVNFELARNSCSNTAHISIVGLVLMLFLVIPQMLMILFSYVKIMGVCLKLSKESRVKTFKTCFPHLVSVANYSVGSFFEIVQSRFDMSYIPLETRVFMSLYFIIIPTIANPILYGFWIQTIRVHIFNILMRKKKPPPPFCLQ